MNQAQLYRKYNKITRRDAEHFCKEFSTVLQWRLDGKDSLLDVGTGSGDVLIDFIYPLMPKDFKKVIGTDISSKMVQYCEKTYSGMEGVHFNTLDITAKELPKKYIEEFDHVTSFYCLHWVHDRRQAMENIFRMLKPNGDCLLVFVAKSPVLDSYNVTSMNPKWAPYMPQAHLYASPYQNSEDAKEDVSQMLEEAGFSNFSVEVRDKVFFYEDRQNLQNNLHAVNAFIDRIPTELQEEYVSDFSQFVVEQNFDETTNERCGIKYKLVVAYARK